LNWSADHKHTAIQKLIRKIHSIRGWLYYALKSKKDLYSLRDIHKGKRCFIICNGPSLNKTDLSFLKDEITFGVNNIYLKFDQIGFLPTYYVVMDDLVIEDRRKELNTLNLCKNKAFFPIEGAYALQNRDNVIWMNCPDNDGEKTIPSFSKCAELFLFHGSTITFICIQLAYHMGFDPVYLVGCDNSYRKPTTVVETSKFWKSTEDDPNHFNPTYFGKGYRWHDPRTDLMTRSYKIARWIYEEEGRQLLNATIGGELEVLERVDYCSLFSGKRP
jgi:hypothetical protein